MKFLLNPVALFVIGMAVGVVAKLSDLYSPELGDIFSDIAVWILFGVLISMYSATRKKAAWNVLLFFIGMLLSYYAVAEWTNSSYGKDIAITWIGIAVLMSLLGPVVWMVNEGGSLSKILRIGISLTCMVSAVLFTNDSIGGYLLNGLIVVILLYHLWFRKKNLAAWRRRGRRR